MAVLWTKQLADKGFTGISLPSNEFAPLTLVYEYHGARSHENAFDNLAPGVAASLPPTVSAGDLPSISGVQTRSLDLGLGLKVLSGLISALGGGTLGLDAGFKSASKITFAYTGVSSETLNAVSLQMALNAVAPPASGLLADWLGDHLFVITSVLRASKITVTAHSDSGAKVGLDVPVISGAASGSVNVDVSHAADGTVTYEGTTPVAFAAKLFQIVPAKIGGAKRLTLKSVKQGSDAIRAFPEEEIEAIDDIATAEPEPVVVEWLADPAAST